MILDTQKSGDIGIILGIFFLIPLFGIKFSQCSFPVPVCTDADLENDNTEKCDSNRRLQMDSQYIIAIIIGAFFIVASYILFYFKLISRSAALGCIYGGMSTLVYSVYANYNRLETKAQMSLIGLILTSFIFLPTLTSQSLVV